MSGLPTINPDKYEDVLAHNNEQVQKLLEQLFPDLRIPYDVIYQTLSYLQETKVNGLILPRVIRGIYNLTVGTGKGQVIVHVRNNVTNIQTREQDDDVETKIEGGD